MSHWMEWGTYVFRGTLEHDDAGGQTLTYVWQPGRGNQMVALYGRLQNADGSARTCQAFIDDGSNQLAEILGSASIGANSVRSWPTSDVPGDGNEISAGAPLVVSGLMRLIYQGLAFAQNAEFRAMMVAKAQEAPTLTTSVGAGTKTEVISTDRLF